ncbi:MAG: hypothetical protein A3F71_06555 [Burkholderiales bacterium RIFCSPLOWO2_12_FULL_64_33]|nr:MAG: hypothetical protein A3C40_20240 [Burkholderiales bacterium RIFCSPHIGHO2_02_FULL_64_19]OGB52291.1 MAG: hypothetical protein A3F71_06555 [Burkholderiales bacterium RIFCSPLOWO2_12_FULL_64_33]
MLTQRGPAGPAFANEAEQPHQLRADAVVDVAHDALALLQGRVLLMLLLQERVADLKLTLALAHLLVQGIAQGLVCTHLAGITTQDQPAHEQHEQHGGQGKIGRAAHAFGGHPNFQEVIQACAYGDEAGKTQRYGLWLPHHQGFAGRHGICPERRHEQQRQASSPTPRLSHTIAPPNQRGLGHHQGPEAPPDADAVATQQRKREAHQQQHVHCQ